MKVSQFFHLEIYIISFFSFTAVYIMKFFKDPFLIASIYIYHHTQKKLFFNEILLFVPFLVLALKFILCKNPSQILLFSRHTKILSFSINSNECKQMIIKCITKNQCGCCKKFLKAKIKQMYLQ